MHSARLIGPLALLWLGGACNRWNPAWCNEGRCGANEICDPATNTCLSRPDLGQPAPDGPASDQPRDTPLPPPPDRLVTADRPPREAAPCAGGAGWVCLAGAALRCDEGGLSKQRLCPLGLCAASHCAMPPSPQSCQKNQECAGSLVCTYLLDSKGGPHRLCAAPAGGIWYGACTSGLQCQSGLCTANGQCYHPCDEQGDCPTLHDCRPTTVNVEGVKVPAESCEKI